MPLNLQIFGDVDEEQAAKVSQFLHRKFDRWSESVNVTLTLSPQGWTIARATATLPSGLDGADLTEGASRVVFYEVRTVLEEAGEPLA